MAALTWSDDLNVGVDVIDEDHRVTVEQLGALLAADDATFPALFDAFVEHLAEHFGREEELMQKTGFFAYGCHSGEHTRVLGEMRGLLAAAKSGRLAMARAYVAEAVPDWFLNHRNTMDLVTANFLQQQMVG
ncbi:MAG TPA: hemerythrin domain-containing protein [Azospirillaceae bacterium]|nr:hemerythrin domain-containing protein [Azospirillaceae bacterium]